MPNLLQVAQLGHPILRQVAPEFDLNGPNLENVQGLIDDMIYTCEDVDGVGIAAPQVYQPLRIFIVASKPNARYPHAPFMDPLAIINPKIIWFSEEMEVDWEGCLSVPGVRALVPRHKSVSFYYTDRSGNRLRTDFSGFIARVFQHEYDHIEGKVFLDRADPKYIVMEKEYLKIINKKN